MQAGMIVLACMGTLVARPVEMETNLSSEWLSSEDIVLCDLAANQAVSQGGRRVDLDVARSSRRIHFSPAPTDLISRSSTRTEQRTAVGLGARWALGERATPSVGAGGYGGYSDFRSLWINEYDRQLYEGMPGYAEAKPRGWHALAGLRYALVPGSCHAQMNLVVQGDHVAPGYEPQLGGDLLRGRERLTSRTAKLSLENVLTRRLRSRLELGITDTTGRKPRLSVQGSLNAAVGERLVLRAVAAASEEAPSFHATSLSLVLEHDWASRLFAGVLLRGYRDSGEIIDPLLVSSAAPSMSTLHAAASLRWKGESLSLRLEAGPYRSRYDAMPLSSRHFSRLYSDRDWFRVQASAAFTWP